MKKHTGGTKSVWMATEKTLRGSPLIQDWECDVCIVGGGIAELSIAYMLAKEGKRVVVLEAGEIGNGETERTTAHLSNALDDRYSEIERIHGKEKAKLVWESHSWAIDQIEKNSRAEEIECDFTRLDGYLFLGKNDTEDTLTKELKSIKEIGITNVEKVLNILLFPQSGPALKFKNQAQFHPLKYLHGLTNAIEKRGGRIFTHTKVKEIVDKEDTYVETENGLQVKADSVVVATNSPIHDNLWIHTKQAAYRTYVIAYEVEKGTVQKNLYWDTEDPYHYVRIVEDNGNDIVLIGGEDHKTGQQDENHDPYVFLRQWAEEVLGMSGEPKDCWSGQVMETIDGLAYIGRDPKYKHIYIVTGDSGMGMTHSTIASVLIPDLINERKNNWEEIYDPARKPVKAIREFLKESINMAAQLPDKILKRDVHSVSDISSGEGAVISEYGKKIAAYKDEQGVLTKCSAVCPHLGCIVDWNNEEKSWDCPCHGSRFTAKGKVIAGPAVSDLSKEL
ncbi:MAG: FAD-dependent oxidoreductase [Candidatus Gracilibacteria bacterium]